MEQLPGVPWITGAGVSAISALHQPLPVAESAIPFEDILNLTQVLSVHEVQADKVDYHGYHEQEPARLRLHSGRM